MNESGLNAAPAALVTGSSRGIGLAVARELAGSGWRVMVHSRSADRARAVALELGPAARSAGVDLTRDDGPAQLVGQALEAFGRLDVLVNNAGMPQIEETATLDAADWRRVVDLNLTAPFLCAQAAGVAMLDGHGGAIVNISSMVAVTGMARRAAYASSKAGLLALTRTLALEWAPTVRVNAVAPGYVRTDLMEGLIDAGDVDIESIRRRTPAGRVGEVSDIAAAVKYLVSPEADFVTGHTLLVDGGWSVNGGV